MTELHNNSLVTLMPDAEIPVYLQEEVAFIQRLMVQDGPEVEDYEAVMTMMHNVFMKRQNGTLTKTDYEYLRILFGSVYSTSKSLLGFVNTRPHGYPGDYEIIEKIYANHISKDKKYRKWDEIFQHRVKAPQAVRNRKTFFKSLLKSKTKNEEDTLAVLNIASGPCRGLNEFFEKNPSANIQVDCVELDKNAIDYATVLLGGNVEKTNFIHKNVFRFEPKKQYDFIWSAGLFDYFDDTVFKRMLTRFLKAVKPNGELIIGNFHPRNPSRPIMEFTNWDLHHRTEMELVDLAHACGVEYDRITLVQEAEGINLFLRIQF